MDYMLCKHELAGERGFEPRPEVSKTSILPLDDSPIDRCEEKDSNLHGACVSSRFTATLLPDAFTSFAILAIGWPVGNRTLIGRLSSACFTIKLQASEL